MVSPEKDRTPGKVAANVTYVYQQPEINYQQAKMAVPSASILCLLGCV